MTDIRADQTTTLDEDRLPWLEAVEDGGEADGPSAVKMILSVLIALVGIGAIVGGIFWLNSRSGPETAGGEPELIKAPAGDYKVAPDEPGGMNVAGAGDTSQQAISGADPKGAINTNGIPEAPVDKNAQQAGAQAGAQTGAQTGGGLLKAPPPSQPAAPAPKAPAAPAPSAGGATVQLGAFSSQAGAQSAWKALSGRFAYLAPLSHTVVPVTSGGKTLYRLRASGPGADNICGRLRVAGESCVKVD